MHFRFLLVFQLLLIPGLFGQTRPVNLGNGPNELDAWLGVNNGSFSGYGGFPGGSVWPSPIGSNTDGSGDAVLNRIAGSPSGGGPFLSTGSIYFGNFAQVPNALGGTLRVSDSTPLQNVKTVLLQIQIGEATGYDFHQPNGYPLLKIDGATNGLPPSYPRYLLSRFQSGTYPSPATEQDEPVYVNTWIFQWNLADEPAVGSFAIDFSGVTHSQIYELRLDQASAAFSSQIIPAASTEAPRLALVSIGAPVFNPSNNTTTIQHIFGGPADTALDIDYSTDLSSSVWTTKTNVLTGTGTFTNIVSATGDLRASWAGKMFFRAKYSSP